MISILSNKLSFMAKADHGFGSAGTKNFFCFFLIIELR
jgi:hypothetical protein